MAYGDDEWVEPRPGELPSALKEGVDEMSPGEPEAREFYRNRYDRSKSTAARKLERLALGHDVGLNGYTTRGQAAYLADILQLATESRVLDVGAGRGWPGTFLAASSGCRVVLTDLPVEALQQAAQYAEARGVSALTDTVCADATALPFGPDTFDVVVHADVFC